MSLVTVSNKRDRIYERAFDHEEANRLRQQGWTYSAIAERYGVSHTAVVRVCQPRTRARMAEQTLEYLRRRRRPCKGGCGQLVWTNGVRTGYCQSCLNARKAAANPDIREDELRCTKCRAWKPDEEFPTYRPVKARRGRNPQCRSCNAAVRRKNRHEHPERERETCERSRAKRGVTKVQKYVILQNGTPGEYREIARVDAVSAKHAVEQTATAEGEYIAVALSRFTPLRVAPVREFRVVTDEKATTA